MKLQDRQRRIRRVPLIERPLAGASRAALALAAVSGFVREWVQYRKLENAERLHILDADPRLSDRVAKSPFDPHYLHQAVWAAERIFENEPAAHVDVGSQLEFVCMLAAKLPVTFVDIRPLALEVAKLTPVAGNALAMPFEDATVNSLSSLHVVEHIGLGRYGDDLDPMGTRRALDEFQRILAPGGSLFLSLPVGRPRVCFNAHRIHDPRDVVAMADRLDLVEFSAVDDSGRLTRGASTDDMAMLRYGCGLFWFKRPE